MLKKANDLRENDPYIIDLLGWALYKLKKYEEAKKYLQLAVQLYQLTQLLMITLVMCYG